MPLTKESRYRNKKILNHARGQRCTCNGPDCITDVDPGYETTVFCHANESFAGKGMGVKAHDFAGFFGCAACHKWYDSNRGSYDDRLFYLCRGMTRTLYILFRDGILK